jgi:hypothetical protein
MLLLLLGSENFPVAGEFYVTVDSIEQLEEQRYRIIFDGVKTDYFKGLIKRDYYLDFEELTPYILYFDVSKQFYDSFFPSIRSRNFNGKWFKIETTTKRNDFPANVSIVNSEFPEFIPVFIKLIAYYSKNEPISQELSDVFSLKYFERASTRNIGKHLYQIRPRGMVQHKLNVYDVGQGSLSAVTDERNVPLLFFDLGGAWWIFPQSYPKTLRLCFRRAKTVILSHWDLDHIETARRLFYDKSNPLDGITWIAPKQNLSPYYLKIAAQMESTGRLLFWSGNNTRRIDFWAGALLKCNGPDKNHSGLALLVKSNDNEIKRVLHPGDAQFQFIPNDGKVELDGLVATHHGADFDFGNEPIPTNGYGNIAYSHGAKYGHPTALAKQTYFNSGWKKELETYKNGNISTGGNISFTKNPCIMNVPCGGNQCDLTVKQVF